MFLPAFTSIIPHSITVLLPPGCFHVTFLFPIYVCMYVCVYVCMYVCMYVPCMYLCMICLCQSTGPQTLLQHEKGKSRKTLTTHFLCRVHTHFDQWISMTFNQI